MVLFLFVIMLVNLHQLSETKMFGVIGDSGALLKLSRKTGTSVQVSGSAAGFMVFYYLLSSGLNPYTHLDVFLYKENGELMRANDGEFEVTVASRISQVKETDTGQAAFSVPRTEPSVRLFVNSISGQLWEKNKVSPSGCVDGDGHILLSCSSVDVQLKKSSACLSDFRISSYEQNPIDTKLAIVVDTLKENLQNLTVDLPVNVEFTDALLEKGVHQIEFRLERKNKSDRGVCEHLAAIENGYNWAQKKRVVRSYLSCNTMLFALSEDNVTEEYVGCL